MQLAPGDARLAQVLDLIRDSFAYMDGRIDPPSSMHRLSLEALSAQAAEAEVWALGDPVSACVVLTVKDGWLYLGKLAVSADRRGQGLARRMVDLAETRVQALGLAGLELQVRVELVENQAAFARLGFAEVGRTAHAGYDRATSITMRRGAQG